MFCDLPEVNYQWKSEYIKKMFNGFYGEHHQVIQIALLAGKVLKEDRVTVSGSGVRGDVKITCAIETFQKCIRIPSSDLSLNKLNKIIRDKLKAAMSNSYGKFCSPNSPIISNKDI